MVRTLLRIFLVLLWPMLLCPIASGQEILILGLNGDLRSVDPDTGQVTYIGSTGFHTHFWSAMTQDSQGKLYASTGDWIVGYSIYEIDPQTGLGTFVVQTNLFGIGCMAFDSGDVLYVGNDRTFPQSGSPYDLHTLNLGTGIATLVGDTGITNMLAMGFDQDVLYGNPFDLGLVTIDTATGIATDVNPTFRGPQGATSSMCFDDEGVLYFINHILWIQDSETGVTSEIEPISPSGFWSGAVFAEGPASKFSLWLSGETGGPVKVKLSGATPQGQVAVAWARGGGGPTPIPSGFPCSGTMMELNSTMRLAGIVIADSLGKAALGPQFVPAAAIGRIRLQAVDLTTCATSNKVTVSY